MNAQDFANLRDLIGLWSCLSIALGLAGVCFSRFSPKASGRFAAGMFLFCAFVEFFVVPASKAYSGPILGEVRDAWRYDKHFAALIALVFAAAFAVDSFRARMRRKA